MLSAVYPGSFDPITNGHIDIIQRALNITDSLHVAIMRNSKKNYLLDISQRTSLAKDVLSKYKNIVVDNFSGLLVNYCKEKNISLIIRGIRAVSDFEYEYAISLMNKRLLPKIDTIFLMSSESHSFISSTIVKEVASYGGDISKEVPPKVQQVLINRYQNKE